MTRPRPQVLPPQPYVFPTPEAHVLENGLRVLLHHMPGQHVLSCSLVVPHDLAAEPREAEGVAAMMARLLDEGTSRRTAEEFAEELELHGGAFGAGVSDGALSVEVDMPARHLRACLDLLADAVADPVFPDDEVRRICTQRLAEIEQERASAPHRAARQLIATLYAADDRASRPTAGSPDTIGALDRETIAAHHRRHVGPAEATLVIGGDLSGLDPLADAAATLGRWTAPEHRPAERPQVPRVAPDAGRVVLVDRPGSVQSELLVATVGPSRAIPSGWAPHPVLAYLLGGSPQSRIDAVLREEKGWTYGIRSVFRPRVAGGTFLTSGSVRAEVTGPALRTLVHLLDAAGEGFTDDEVRSGVDFLARTAPGRFATAGAVVDETASLVLERLPLDFPTTNLDRQARLGSDDLVQAWHQVAPPAWTIVVVGDAAVVADQIRAAGFSLSAVVAA